MKRLNLFLGAAALIAVSLTASPALMAQENGNRDEYGKIVRGPYETNRFGDNWFIGVGGGINAFWNEGLSWDNMKIAPSIDAGFGKWFTPSVGMRVGYQGINSQVWSETATVLGPTLDKDKGMYLEKFGYMYVHGDFLWNASNAFGGYKETRFWNLIPYLHAGYYRSYGMDNVDFSDNELAAGAGLLHNLRLADRLDLVIDMRATVVIKKGYAVVNLYKNGKMSSKTVHRLVAQAFLPNPNNLPCVNHKNGIKLDNRVENLEWTTNAENTKHAFDNNLGGFRDKALKQLEIINNHEYSKIELIKNDVVITFKNTQEVSDFLGLKKQSIADAIKNKKKLKHYTLKGYKGIANEETLPE